jgi:hypothetical protein
MSEDKLPYLVEAVHEIKNKVEATSEQRKKNWDLMNAMIEKFPGVTLIVIDPVQLTSELRIKSAKERLLLITPSDRTEHFTVHSDNGAEENFRPAGWGMRTIAKRIAADVYSSININKQRKRNTQVSAPAPLNT